MDLKATISMFFQDLLIIVLVTAIIRMFFQGASLMHTMAIIRVFFLSLRPMVLNAIISMFFQDPNMLLVTTIWTEYI